MMVSLMRRLLSLAMIWRGAGGGWPSAYSAGTFPILWDTSMSDISSWGRSFMPALKRCRSFSSVFPGVDSGTPYTRMEGFRLYCSRSFILSVRTRFSFLRFKISSSRCLIILFSLTTVYCNSATASLIWVVDLATVLSNIKQNLLTISSFSRASIKWLVKSSMMNFIRPLVGIRCITCRQQQNDHQVALGARHGPLNTVSIEARKKTHLTAQATNAMA